MGRRPLGKTGAQVSPIGFGAFKIGRNVGVKYPSAYDIPHERAATHLLNSMLDLGVNLIDTAPAYGLSEERIGRAIGHRRDQFLLCTKVGELFEDGRSTFDFSASAVRASVDRSRRRLRADVIDIVSIHSSGDDLTVLRETDVVATLQGLRGQGMIRWIGFSGKTVEGAAAAIEFADVLMVEYHRQDRSHEPVIAVARDAGVGILVKKGLASGRLPAEEGIRFVLSNPGVSSMVVGSLDLEHIESNLHIAATL